MVPISSSHVHEVKTFYLRYSTTGECVIVINGTINLGNMYLQIEKEKMRRRRVGGSKKKLPISVRWGIRFSVAFYILVDNNFQRKFTTKLKIISCRTTSTSSSAAAATASDLLPLIVINAATEAVGTCGVCPWWHHFKQPQTHMSSGNSLARKAERGNLTR